MPTPLPHQLTGAEFLARRRAALLADAPRVGKTGAAIIAADYAGADRILVITTASGRPVWHKAFPEWSAFDRSVHVVYSALTPEALKADRLVVGWPVLAKLAPVLAEERWDVIIPDESHFAKNPTAKRTLALFGRSGIYKAAGAVWPLTGTPIPNAPNDLWPMLRALAPERIKGAETYDAFTRRYCVVRKKFLGHGRSVDIVVAGRNLDELRERLDGFWLRRTQADVGIREPFYDTFPIHISDAQRRKIEAEVEDADEILAAAEADDTASLEMHMGPLRRITGAIKARAVVEAVKEEFACGLDKIVLMAWHRDTLDALETGLSEHGVARVDGSTSPARRETAMQAFQSSPSCRVFIGQITACGEAIDLSAAANLIFVEQSFVPKDMAQAALRITNHAQTRQCLVRVACLEGSIDEALSRVLVRKVRTNRQIFN